MAPDGSKGRRSGVGAKRMLLAFARGLST
jgi:hypothetical protein